jgi:hypothetical protein
MKHATVRRSLFLAEETNLMLLENMPNRIRNNKNMVGLIDLFAAKKMFATLLQNEDNILRISVLWSVIINQYRYRLVSVQIA